MSQLKYRVAFGAMIFTGLLFLSSCSAYNALTKPQKGHPAGDQINAALQTSIANNNQMNAHGKGQLPSNVSSELLPRLNIQAPAQANTEKHFDVAVNNVPARAFFLNLVKGTKYNMVVSPKVAGTITLTLKHVTIQNVLSATRDLYGYEYKITPYGFHVMPAGLETRVFKVNYINMERTGDSHTSVSSGQITEQTSSDSASGGGSTSTESKANPSSDVDTKTTSNFWATLDLTLKSLIGTKKGQRIVVNQSAGLVIVTATTAQLHQVAKYLDLVQASVNREVLIDAKILEIQLSAGYQAGINWDILGLQQTGLGADNTGAITDTGQNSIDNGLKVFTSLLSINAKGHGFNMLIKLLSTQGNVQVLSSPRIATLNNQKAVIKVGQDQYFITNVSNTTVTGTSTENTQDVDLEPFFSGIALDVTPEIDAKGDVILHIHPIISTVTQRELSYTVGSNSQTIPSASTKIRESDNIVRAKSGQVVAIGGLMENNTAETNAATPFLGKMPIVGPLFRRANQQGTKMELVILLKPVVMNNLTINQKLKKVAQAFRHANKGFSFGPHPKTFGNLGEPTVKMMQRRAARRNHVAQKKRVKKVYAPKGDNPYWMK
jgi:MSHA biogenesis protein MshL